MQSDAVACRVDVVNVSFIEEICPKEYPVFLEIRKRTSLERVLTGTKEQPAWALEEAHLDFLQVVHKDGEVNIAYKKLQKAFCHRTGLKLFIDWHNSEEYGSSQDDVSEEFWYVEGVWKLSPAGEKYRDKIQLDAMYIITE